LLCWLTRRRISLFSTDTFWSLFVYVCIRTSKVLIAYTINVLLASSANFTLCSKAIMFVTKLFHQVSENKNADRLNFITFFFLQISFAL
jgi:hypothetical protein